MSDGCSNITAIADPVEQCLYAKHNCQLGSIIPYAEIIYCHIPSSWVRIAVLSFLLLLNFGIMGIAAFDYLSPNLTHLADISGLSQSLMGVTVLAFGNGSVDVFGAFAALSHGEGGMAFGEIMGGALFVCSVVVGSMALIKPFQIEPHFTLRDVAILGFTTVFTIVILADGVVSITEALIGLLIYSLYAAFIVHQQLVQTQRRHEELANLPEIPHIEEPEDSFIPSPNSVHSSDPPFTPIRQSLYSAVDIGWKVHQHIDELESRTPPPMLPSNSINVQPMHKRRRSSAPLPTTSNSDQTFGKPDTVLPTVSTNAFSSPAFGTPVSDNVESGSNRSSNSNSDRRLLSPHDLPKLHTGSSNYPSDPASSRIHLESAGAYSDRSQDTINPNQPYINPFNDASSMDNIPIGENATHLRHHGHHTHSHHPQHHHNHYEHYPNYGQHTMQYLVSQLLEEHKQTRGNSPVANRVSSESSGDSQSTITLDNTLCNSDSSDSETVSSAGMSWWLYVFPSITDWKEMTWIHRINVILGAPVLSLLSCSIPLPMTSESHTQMCVYSIGVPIILPIIMPSIESSYRLLVLQLLCVGLALLWWGKLKRPLPSSLLIALIGFTMGLLWVLLLAKELVALLTILGEVCNVSNTMMGLTVFALGDSLGDLVSNLTVARIGFSTMAISACFGGPIFTLLVGVCGASLITMLNQRALQLDIPVTSSLMFSGFGLLSVLTLFVLSVLRNKFTVTRSLGLQLICLWVVILLGSMTISNSYI